jgi:hypothetical protein
VPGGLGTSIPVLLVHGFHEGPAVWNQGTPTMLEAIDAIPGVKAVSFNYSSWNTMWVTNIHIGACLATWITSLATTSKNAGGPGKVIIVAHSMGGLAVRCAVDPKCVNYYHKTGPPWQAADASQIGLVITLGTPNLGSWVDTPVSRPFLLSAACKLIPLCPNLAKALAANSPAAQAMQEQSLNPETPSGDLAKLKSWPAIGVPLDAVAGRITLTTSLFGRGPFCIFCAGELGDGAVSVGSAQAGGAQAESTTIDCGYIPVDGLPPYSLISPLAALVTLKCWHLTEETDPAFQAEVVSRIKAAVPTLTIAPCTSATLASALRAANVQLHLQLLLPENWVVKGYACQSGYALAGLGGIGYPSDVIYKQQGPSWMFVCVLGEFNTCSTEQNGRIVRVSKSLEPSQALLQSLMRKAGFGQPAATPQLFVHNGYELGSLYTYPNFPAKIGLDNVDYLSGLRWTQVNSSSATATGTLNVDNCKPDCASGTQVQYPVQLVASNPQQCTVTVYTPSTGASQQMQADVFNQIQVTALSGNPPSFLVGTSPPVLPPACG